MPDPLKKVLDALPYDIDNEGNAHYSDEDIPDVFENDFDEDNEDMDCDDYHQTDIEEIEF